MQKSYQQRKSGLTTSASASLSLPTQMAYGGTHRPGATKLDIRLRQLGLLSHGKVLNPQRGEYRMGFPIDWTDLQPSVTQLSLL
jgi:hypothetical protein